MRGSSASLSAAMMAFQSSLLIPLLLQVILTVASRPNIVFVLTDDQDVTMGGQTPMVKTKKLVGDKGMIFENMFVSSPLCCPSRSSIFSGRYVHNHRTLNNSLDGNCSSLNWQINQEATAFPTVIKSKGYSTFFAGKYLNQYGTKGAGGVAHVPPGWDVWNGLVGNSKYYNYKLSVNGVEEAHGNKYPEDYLTDVIHRRAIEFLQKRKGSSDPFFMMLSTPACHGPFTPAPEYNSSYPDEMSPRNGSYNMKAKDKHWLVEHAIVPMPQEVADNSDDIYRRRWRTLISVDNMVEDVINTLDTSGELDNTYVFFSSDNGYHFGQFGLPNDKRQLYEFDIRVPLMVRGPGINAGQVADEPVMNIDFAPTFVEIVDDTVILPNIDGISLLPLLHRSKHRTQPPPPRYTILIEHTGEYITKSECGQNLANCNSYCVCEDSKNNTFSCVIDFNAGETFKYCELNDDVNFVELYDTETDPYEFNNMRDIINPVTKSDLQKKLRYLEKCSGSKCINVPSF